MTILTHHFICTFKMTIFKHHSRGYINIYIALVHFYWPFCMYILNDIFWTPFSRLHEYVHSIGPFLLTIFNLHFKWQFMTIFTYHFICTFKMTIFEHHFRGYMNMYIALVHYSDHLLCTFSMTIYDHFKSPFYMYI